MKVLGYNFSVKKTAISAKTENKGKTRTNPAIIKIAQGFRDKSRKDIDKWRKSLEMMAHPDEPRYDMYYEIVDDLLTDGHLQSQIQLRKMSTMNTDFEIINGKTGDVNDELTELFNQQWFFEFLGHAMDSVMFGATLVEFRGFNDRHIDLELIPRKHVVSTKSKIIPDLQNPEFIDYSDDRFKDWLIQIGKAGDIGLINNIIYNIIWIRNVMQAWAEFCEKFGMPLITAETSVTDQAKLQNIHEMLLEIGQAGAGTFPPGTQVTFHEAKRTDAYNTYLHFLKENKEAISKAIVGSTMLTDQGSNRSQTEVHERGLDDKIALADKRMITFLINDQLLPLLARQGYKVTENDTFRFKNVEQSLDIKDLWSVTEGLMQNGYEIPTDWLSKSFNIPIEAKKKALTATASNQTEVITSQYPIAQLSSSCCPDHPVAVSSQFGNIWKNLRTQLIDFLHQEKDPTAIASQMIVAEALELREALNSGFSGAIQYNTPDSLMLQLMEYNLFEFSTSKTEARLAAMTDLLIDKENKSIRAYNEFKALCEKETSEFDNNYLRTEYNLSVAVGQNSAAYTRFLAEKDTVTSFVQYQTIGDDKVRNSHRNLDGKVFNLNDKEAMDLLPPNGYGCRCEFVQYLGDKDSKFISGKQAKATLLRDDPRYKGSQFEINRANLKQVFTESQFYMKSKGLDKDINALSFGDYGLKSSKELSASKGALKLDKTITKDNVNELFKPLKGTDKMGFTDYLGRKMTLKKSKLNNNEHQLFPHLSEVLNAPDEVWYSKNKNGKYQSSYLKFYKNKTIVVDGDLDAKQGLEIKAWRSLDDEKKYRKGLKIK